jgi:radical SAM superfamily enzyme YgiQ (UPF0313 family)
MLIATSILEKEGHDVKFIDGAPLNLKEKDIRDILGDFRPNMVVLHTTTPSIYNDLSYARLAKETLGALTVLIGPHPSVEYIDTFSKAHGAVDIIVRGEYDYTLRELAHNLDISRNAIEGLKDIKGICYLDGEGKILYNEDRELLDVNELPFPAWHHIRPEWYRDAGKRFPFLTLISGRGCPGGCTFCRDTSVMYKRKLRLRSPKGIVDEIEYDRRLFPYIKEIMFETDTFAASPEHARGICEEILKRKVRLTWSCNVRVDMELSLLDIMKKAGCRMLMVGFEFGTQEALDSVKKDITLEQSKRFSEEAHRLGFIIHGCFMIGAPGETRHSVIKTVDLARELPLDTVQFSGICAYPGTEIYNWAKTNGYLLPGDWRGWVNKDSEQVTVLSFPQLTKNEMDELIDLGLRAFYLRPGQIAKMLFSMRNLGDLKRRLFGIKGSIGYIGSRRT